MNNLEVLLYPIRTGLLALLFLVLTVLTVIFIIKKRNGEKPILTAIKSIIPLILFVLFIIQGMSVFYILKGRIDLGFANRAEQRDYNLPASELRAGAGLSFIPADKYMGYKTAISLLETYPKNYDEGLDELIELYNLLEKYAGKKLIENPTKDYLDYSRLYLFKGDIDKAIEGAERRQAYPLLAIAYVMKGDKLKKAGVGDETVYNYYNTALDYMKIPGKTRFIDMLIIHQKLGGNMIADAFFEFEKQEKKEALEKNKINKETYNRDIKALNDKYYGFEDYYERVYSKENYDKLAECTRYITDNEPKKTYTCMLDVLWP